MSATLDQAIIAARKYKEQNVRRETVEATLKIVTTEDIAKKAIAEVFGTDRASTPDEIKIVETLPEEPKTVTPERVMSKFEKIARAAIARGENRVLPIEVGGKNPAISWVNAEPPANDIDTMTAEQWAGRVESWVVELANQFPDLNACVVAKPNEFCFIDCDTYREFVAGYEAFAGEQFPVTYTTSASENRTQIHFRQTDATRKLGNVGQFQSGDVNISVRQRNLYVLAEGSQHPSGSTYQRVVDSVIAPMPDKMVEYIHHLLTGKPKVENAAAEKFELPDFRKRVEYPRDSNGLIPPGHRHNATLQELGDMHYRKEFVDDVDAREEALIAWREKNVVSPRSIEQDGKVRKMVESSMNWPPSPKLEMGSSARGAAYDTPEGQAARAQAAQPEIDIAALAGEKTESAPTDDAELDKEFPVIPLPPQPGPYWNDSILYGPLGEIAKRACEYSESHPAGVYLDLIVSVGNLIGRKPYFRINNTEHHTNEFMIRVGPTSTGRKGGGRDTVDAIMKLVDRDWATTRVMSGFGSGEAVIDPIRDSFMQQMRDKKRNGAFTTIPVPGSPDKRLFIRAGEIAGTFAVASREGSRMSDIIRDGWDSKPLRNQVKGKTDGISNTLTCQEPHISVSGDCTAEELIDVLPDNSTENGFANRFIYCYVHRVKLCPLGGPDVDWSQDVARLHQVILHVNDTRYVGLTKAAEKMWARMYVDLSQQETPGMAGKVTARAAAHIRRIALILALVDLEEWVDSHHLKAARAIWDYCQQSAEYIFSGMTREQARIVRFVEKQASATGKTVTDRSICDDVFHRNEPIAWVKAQIDGLVQTGHLIRNGDVVSRGGKI